MPGVVELLFKSIGHPDQMYWQVGLFFLSSGWEALIDEDRQCWLM